MTEQRINIAEIRTAAEAATPGDWHVGDSAPAHPESGQIKSGERWIAAMSGSMSNPAIAADASFIAAANPTVVLALVEAVEAARAYQVAMEKIAYEWRLDWSQFDGRTLRDQEMHAAAALVAALAPFAEETA